MMRAGGNPTVIHAEQVFNRRRAQLALAAKIEREWNNLEKLEAELRSCERLGESRV